MSRHVILRLAAAMLVGTIFVSGDALAHYGGRIHAVGACVRAGWDPFSRNAGQAGYPGGHYGCDCYRAANGRSICRFY
jgi:hypothetical protein